MRLARLSRIVWAVSLPVVFAEVSETILHVTDTIFLGRVGVTELAAVGFADSIFDLFLILTIGLTEAMQILVARRAGEGSPRLVGESFNQGMVLLLTTAVVVTVLLKVSTPLVLEALVEGPALGSAVNTYLQIVAYGIVFHGLNFGFSSLFVGLAKTRVLIWATILLGGVNLAVDYILIFGKFGAPALGIAGAALGSVAAEAITFAFFIAYTLRYLDIRKYGLFRFFARQADAVSSWGSLLRLSLPVAAQGLVEAIRWFAFFVILEAIGEEALAVSNILFATMAVFLIPTGGFAETASTFVSRYIGKERADRISRLMREVTAPAYLLSAPFILLALFAPEWIASLFTTNAGVIAASGPALRVLAVTMIVLIASEMWFAAVAGTGDTPALFGIEVLVTTVMLGVAYFVGISMEASVAAVWTSLAAASVVGLALSYGWMRSGIWKRLEI